MQVSEGQVTVSRMQSRNDAAVGVDLKQPTQNSSQPSDYEQKIASTPNSPFFDEVKQQLRPNYETQDRSIGQQNTVGDTVEVNE